jgi:hypothetical protein
VLNCGERNAEPDLNGEIAKGLGKCLPKAAKGSALRHARATRKATQINTLHPMKSNPSEPYRKPIANPIANITPLQLQTGAK